ncbi:uncharacterized protein NESG_01884 [Nematocida ausubeli]|uniref:Uncharacterized protein n=1 Tax=Nematocida ausubeli (strain ATCC PRA-371 / ERTm2) TaxID=1913371 RepID=A0A086J178_NEMA1|nr:uncharacterized protein NESG_01884 [Nematocida ausubeli]KAI5137016.1 hypothetical protein NEAUS06_2067 [Nematocida ausubeli]KAI5150228.1 hypothetical protein NEAUS05_2089 [Nematocida ausubeli]KFG25896.1 hypothetical protein NESG_01884 [Nematocida ausubeli]
MRRQIIFFYYTSNCFGHCVHQSKLSLPSGKHPIRRWMKCFNCAKVCFGNFSSKNKSNNCIILGRQVQFYAVDYGRMQAPAKKTQITRWVEKAAGKMVFSKMQLLFILFMERKEKTSLIQMLNTSIGNISGLFKQKKQETESKDVELEEIAASQEKEESESFLLDEEEEFEKDLSRLSISMEEGMESKRTGSLENKMEAASTTNTFVDEINKLKKIIALKDEIWLKEREKDKETSELRILESIKTQAELDYEKKRRKILLQTIDSLERRLEESEIQCLELMKYCNLLIEQQESAGAEKKK